MGAFAMFAETLIQGHWLQNSDRLQRAHQRTWSDEFSRELAVMNGTVNRCECERSRSALQRTLTTCRKDSSGRRPFAVPIAARWRATAHVAGSPSHVTRSGASFATSSLAGYATSCTDISNSIPVQSYNTSISSGCWAFPAAPASFLVYYVRQSTSSMIISSMVEEEKWTWGGSIAAQYSRRRRRLLVIRPVRFEL
jgi:hypothetical protein